MQTAEWKTKDGTKIRICDMKDEHIIHCLNLLQTWCNNRRGNRPFIKSVRPIFWLLLEEAEDRGIIEKLDLELFEDRNLKLRMVRR